MNLKVFALLILLSTSLRAEESLPGGVNLGGFLDTQAQWTKDTASEGFSIYDAALYLKKDFKTASVLIDLPFAYEGTAGSNSFKFGKDKAQAYLDWRLVDKLLALRLGQMDTIFGLESNDSADNIFSRASFISGAIRTPTTHTGALGDVSHELQGGTLHVKALASNATNSGQKNNKNFEYGGQIGFENDWLQASTGGLFFDEGEKTRTYVNAVLSVTGRVFKVGAEFGFLKDDTTDGNNTKGFAALGQAAVTPIEKLSLAARAGFGSKVVGAYSILQGTFGPQYEVSDNLRLKADYTTTRTEETEGADTLTTHELVAAAVVKF